MAGSFVDDPLWKLHVRKIVEAILAGKVVPFLGADVNLCDRPQGDDGREQPWSIQASFPPSNQELALYLDGYSEGLGPAYHHELACPFYGTDQPGQLPAGCPLRLGSAKLRLEVENVSQYVASGEDGEAELDAALSSLFEKKYQPNSLHRFLASLPAVLRSRSASPVYPLIVTTCFDNALERAFADMREPIDLVSFIGDSQGGHFQHQTPVDKRIDIADPNTYSELDMGRRPVILKLYGGYASGSFQITEDHYIDYLSHRGMAELIPSSLLRVLRANDTNLWFLGYSLSLWNQRVIIRRLWQEKIKESGKPWWAIQGLPNPSDTRIWRGYLVKVLQHTDFRMEDYISEVDARLRASLPESSAEAMSNPISSTSREGIFISYSHEDTKWLEQIKMALAPAIRFGQLSMWDDTLIKPGSKWRDDIKKALDSAKVALLLVSQAFLASEFIASSELPILLEAAEKEGMIICWVLLEKCLFDLTAIKDYQSVWDTAKPLSGLTPAKRSEALDEIARKIMDLQSSK